MAGIPIDYAALEVAFENHAPDVVNYLARETGELIAVSRNDDDHPDALRVTAHPDKHIRVEPVASRDQYRMMEQFIETVTIGPLQQQLKDAIVGKGAFRRFKDAVARVPDERKRWFAFRDVLLHQHILEWLKAAQVELLEFPDWNIELPEPLPPGAESEEPNEDAPVVATPGPEPEDLAHYLQAWARAHGPEYRHLFGPAAFERLAHDLTQEFSFFRRKS